MTEKRQCSDHHFSPPQQDYDWDEQGNLVPTEKRIICLDCAHSESVPKEVQP